MANNENLTEAERKLFEDASIEAAYKTWAGSPDNPVAKPGKEPTRKQFLMRIRFLLQSGQIDRS